ncbi:ParA family protein [Ramlibacter sp. AN1133]|uniref:ParA family protein n=1 Tax=Ramlibacter sp. AN1133 TaxID=3133429 RepID=UPI0030C42F70
MAAKRPAVVISVFNEKGGSGKTTTACQLAGTLGRRGYDVCVADCDAQETATKWLQRLGGKNFPASLWSGHGYGADVAMQLGVQASKYDIIVVDCAPSVEQASTWGALLVSSLAIIPTRLNMGDLAALPAAKRLVRKVWDTLHENAVQAGRTPAPNFPARVLPVAARLHLKDEEKALESQSKDKEFPLASVPLGDRKAYPRSMIYGSSVHNVPNSADSIREVEALVDEVLTILKMPLQREERLAA